MDLNELPASDWTGVDDDTVEEHSGEKSVVLADALAARTCWPVVFAAADPIVWPRGAWAQAGVEAPDGRVVDVAGLHDAGMWLGTWGEHVDVWFTDEDRAAGYTGDEVTVVRAEDLGYEPGAGMAHTTPEARATAAALADRIATDPAFLTAFGDVPAPRTSLEVMARAEETVRAAFGSEQEIPQRDLAQAAAADVLDGSTTLVAIGEQYVEATATYARAEARLVGALAVTDAIAPASTEALAAEAGVAPQVVAGLLNRDPLIVYTSPTCQPCKYTKRALDKRGVPYIEKDIATDAQARQEAVALGYSQVPVVVTPDGEHWSGLRPDKIEQAAKAYNTPEPGPLGAGTLPGGQSPAGPGPALGI